MKKINVLIILCLVTLVLSSCVNVRNMIDEDAIKLTELYKADGYEPKYTYYIDTVIRGGSSFQLFGYWIPSYYAEYSAAFYPDNTVSTLINGSVYENDREYKKKVDETISKSVPSDTVIPKVNLDAVKIIKLPEYTFALYCNLTENQSYDCRLFRLKTADNPELEKYSDMFPVSKEDVKDWKASFAICGDLIFVYGTRRFDFDLNETQNGAELAERVPDSRVYNGTQDDFIRLIKLKDREKLPEIFENVNSVKFSYKVDKMYYCIIDHYIVEFNTAGDLLRAAEISGYSVDRVSLCYSPDKTELYDIIF